jgi:hypothetical protein
MHDRNLRGRLTTMMKRWMSTTVLTSTSFLAFSGIDSAHVTVWPKDTKANAYERYTVRVPVEIWDNRRVDRGHLLKAELKETWQELTYPTHFDNH